MERIHLARLNRYLWEQISGIDVTLENANADSPTFIAPNTATTLEFRLTVEGLGTQSTSTVSVQVVESGTVPVANAGPDQTVIQGTVVELNGTLSSDAVTYQWDQLSGPTVILSDDNTATPSFIFPKQPVSLVFRLTVSGPVGSSTDTVQISTIPDTITATRIEFRTQTAQWRIEGTSSITGPGVTMTIFLGNTNSGTVLAEAEVDALGQWEYRESGTIIQPDASRVVTIQSSSGGILEAVPVTIRR